MSGVEEGEDLNVLHIHIDFKPNGIFFVVLAIQVSVES